MIYGEKKGKKKTKNDKRFLPTDLFSYHSEVTLWKNDLAVFVTVPLRCLHLNDLYYDWLIIWMCLNFVFTAWSRQCAEEGPAPAGSEAGRVRESPLLNQSSGGGTDRNRKTAGEETQTRGGGSAEGLTRMRHTPRSLTQLFHEFCNN